MLYRFKKYECLIKKVKNFNTFVGVIRSKILMVKLSILTILMIFDDFPSKQENIIPVSLADTIF